ncbi:translation elongation factor EF-1 beta [Candidatus Nitrosocosmicus arcticus]|uniref:Elongation factor 1-beta n=2 Tax=Candidatus Nitrosocosmicus arcticus TaxID=2035267 RepID=A0A557SXB9_9ARCH|nr:translation elongation factor EF-1 beta [Candidatus Nitrosocosmicus arcticus]
MCRLWIRGAVIKMARLVARIKILPADSETDMDAFANNLKSGVPEGMELKAHAKEPIAFGINALVGDFLLDDAEGEMDKLEESIKKIEGAGEIQVINISRQSVKMK